MQRGAIRALELEAEIREHRTVRATLEAKTRARELIEEAGLASGDDASAEALAALPYTADGRLHEEAFHALIDHLQWKHQAPARVLRLATTGAD
ncbi:hypothetical protein [Nocardioides antri]|uniref:Uncharacterized protein n=1 Tax=Nocardioides antri TaxID=2607659 RepID=A0A5B1M131_9ACTN|nr:hypothetical protein [Nocardioides antri]KAA1426461.1 hypothetical protein F0U47_13745 [Nocardioides antri]